MAIPAHPIDIGKRGLAVPDCILQVRGYGFFIHVDWVEVYTKPFCSPSSNICTIMVSLPLTIYEILLYLPDSSTPLSLSNCTVEHLTLDTLPEPSFPSRAPSRLTRSTTIPAIAEESIPPLRHRRTGTSARRRSLTDSSNRLRTPSIISSADRVSTCLCGRLAVGPCTNEIWAYFIGIRSIPTGMLFNIFEIPAYQIVTRQYLKKSNQQINQVFLLLAPHASRSRIPTECTPSKNVRELNFHECSLNPRRLHSDVHPNGKNHLRPNKQPPLSNRIIKRLNSIPVPRSNKHVSHRTSANSPRR